MLHSMTSQRVAIVTGGSRGIGRAVVRRLAADGFKVVVNYAGNEQEANAAVEEAGAENAIAVQADVADEHAVEALFAAATERFGGVDVVVHAAGRMDLAPLADFDLDVLDEQVRVNLRGTFVVSQHAVRTLRDGGALINFSSSVVGLAFPTYSVYAATKGARRGDDARARPRAARARRHRQRRRARPDRHRPLPRRQGPGDDRPRRAAAAAAAARHARGHRRTSSRSSPAPTAAGSTARCCAPTAA